MYRQCTCKVGLQFADWMLIYFNIGWADGIQFVLDNNCKIYRNVKSESERPIAFNVSKIYLKSKTPPKFSCFVHKLIIFKNIKLFRLFPTMNQLIQITIFSHYLLSPSLTLCNTIGYRYSIPLLFNIIKKTILTENLPDRSSHTAVTSKSFHFL